MGSENPRINVSIVSTWLFALLMSVVLVSMFVVFDGQYDRNKWYEIHWTPGEETVDFLLFEDAHLRDIDTWMSLNERVLVNLDVPGGSRVISNYAGGKYQHIDSIDELRYAIKKDLLWTPGSNEDNVSLLILMVVLTLIAWSPIVIPLLKRVVCACLRQLRAVFSKFRSQKENFWIWVWRCSILSAVIIILIVLV